MLRIALLQLTSSDDPAGNLAIVRDLLAQARESGAALALTPEVTNCVASDPARQEAVLQPEALDQTLSGLRQAAAELDLWLLIGSLALKTGDADGRYANRSFLVDDTGEVRARYDKIHMFDVQVTEAETYRESARFRPGDRAVVAETPWGGLGMTVCYDVRFPHLHRALARAGAVMLSVPAAFSPVTGAAHWEVLLRARAIETGCFVLAPAQTGAHRLSAGKPRRTHGHSLVVAPWGEVLLDAGTEPGVFLVDLDLSRVQEARQRVPALTHDRPFAGPG